MKTAVLQQAGQVLVPRVLLATGLVERMRGLLGRKSLEPGVGMLLCPCGSVHTFGMRFPIDVVYLDACWRVTRIVHRLKAQRMSFGGLRARAALELQSGWFDLSRIAPDTPVEIGDLDLRHPGAAGGLVAAFIRNVSPPGRSDSLRGCRCRQSGRNHHGQHPPAAR